jgi:hypothetical protein
LASKSIGNGRGAGGNPAATHDGIKARKGAIAHKCRKKRNITRSYPTVNGTSVIANMSVNPRKKPLSKFQSPAAVYGNASREIGKQRPAHPKLKFPHDEKPLFNGRAPGTDVQAGRLPGC